MATITSARVVVGRTLNMGNFQSLKVEAEVSVHLGEGETLAAATGAVQAQLRELWETTYRAQKKGELPL